MELGVPPPPPCYLVAPLVRYLRLQEKANERIVEQRAQLNIKILPDTTAKEKEILIFCNFEI